MEREEGINTRNTGDFEGGEIFLQDTLMVDTCNSTFVKTQLLVKQQERSQCKLCNLVNKNRSMLTH